MANEPISPKMVQAPVREKPTLDAKAYAEEIRSRRGDISTMESRLGLNAKAPEGWEWRWFNDDGDRIPRALTDGWRFVKPEAVGMSESVGRGNDDLGESRVTKTTTLGGAPIKTVLMEVPIEIANELRDIRSLSTVRRFEEQINRGGPAGISDSPHIYNPGDNPQSSFHGVKNHIGREAS